MDGSYAKQLPEKNVRFLPSQEKNVFHIRVIKCQVVNFCSLLDRFSWSNTLETNNWFACHAPEGKGQPTIGPHVKDTISGSLCAHTSTDTRPPFCLFREAEPPVLYIGIRNYIIKRPQNLSPVHYTMRKSISEVVAARPGIEPRTSCSASQEVTCNYYTTAAPVNLVVLAVEWSDAASCKTIAVKSSRFLPSQEKKWYHIHVRAIDGAVFKVLCVARPTSMIGHYWNGQQCNVIVELINYLSCTYQMKVGRNKHYKAETGLLVHGRKSLSIKR